MRRTLLRQNFWIGLLLGVVFTVIFILLKIQLFHSTAYQGPYALLLLAVIIASLYGGYIAGGITLVLGTVLGTYFFAMPFHTFQINSTTDRIGLTIYVIQSVVVIFVIHVLIRQERRLRLAQEEGVRSKQVAESRLRDIETSEGRFRALVDSNIIGVMFWESNGLVFDANKAFLDAVGFNENELLNGKINWSSLTPSDDREEDEKDLAVLRTHGKTPIFEKDCVRKDGKRIRVLIAAARLEKDGERAVAFVLPLNQVKKSDRL